MQLNALIAISKKLKIQKNSPNEIVQFLFDSDVSYGNDAPESIIKIMKKRLKVGRDFKRKQEINTFM